MKVITDLHGYALYFSRGVLPSNKSGEPQPFPVPFHDHQYLLHLGLQCYDSNFLKTYCHLPPTPLMVGRTLIDLACTLAVCYLLLDYWLSFTQFITQSCFVHIQLLCIGPLAAVGCRLTHVALQVMEDLEQLKVLEHGYKMKTVVVHNAFHGVDEPGDIEALEHLMRQQGIN